MGGLIAGLVDGVGEFGDFADTIGGFELDGGASPASGSSPNTAHACHQPDENPLTRITNNVVEQHGRSDAGRR
jgi:hypothetical protein